MSVKHKDINGHDIKPGNYVLYAALWDRSATLKYGIVVKLKKREKRWSFNDHEDDEPTVGVISVDRTYKSYDNGQPTGLIWGLQAKGKEVTLGFLDRLCVVHEESVPKAVRKILDEYKP